MIEIIENEVDLIDSARIPKIRKPRLLKRSRFKTVKIPMGYRYVNQSVLPEPDKVRIHFEKVGDKLLEGNLR